MSTLNNLQEFPGFSVYDMETGEPIEDIEFMLGQDGDAFEVTDGWHGFGDLRHREVAEFKKHGKYALQVGTEMYKL